MNKEYYRKYYIQGSDHYLLPRDVFDELFREMSNWKEEVDYLLKTKEELREENKILKEKILNFLQYILDQWELDTKDIQDKALEILKEIGE